MSESPSAESAGAENAKRRGYPSASTVFRDWRLLLAFGFGSGLSRILPGTCGTLAALPLWWVLSYLDLYSYLAVVFVATLLGIRLCAYAANKLGVHDHGGIVWDEFVGLWITLIAIPRELTLVLVGFVLFRLFDMWKPWPIRWVDRKVGGGFGIMIDDVLAALLALMVLHGARFYAL